MAEGDHALLADILGAVEHEHSRGRGAVLDEELGLELGLREVLEEDARRNLLGKSVDQSDGDSFIISVTQTRLVHEVVEVQKLHVGSSAESLTKAGLAGSLGADHEEDLGEHGLAGVLVDDTSVTVSIDLTDLLEFLVELDDGLGLLVVGCETFLEDLGLVVSAVAGLSALEAPLEASLLVDVEVEDGLGRADVLLEVHGLVEGSWEAIDQVILKFENS